MYATDTRPDPQPGNYYVTVVRNRGLNWDYRPLLGPFVNNHAAALAAVGDVFRLACDIDPRACWYSFGTSRFPDYNAPGLLNDRLGHLLETTDHAGNE